ncbi:MAG: hypothetical protein ACLPM8_17920 [Myxococcaceae bacterium]
MRRSLLVVCALAAVACSHSPVAPISFPASNAQFGKPMSPSLPPCAQAVTVSVADHRANPAVIGERHPQETPTVQYPIQMTGDVSTYVQNGLTLRLKQAGAIAPNASQETMSVDLTQLYLSESVGHSSDYSADMTFQAVVKRPGSAQACWQGPVRASATNFGSSGSTENYQETLDRVLDAAMVELVRAAGFADALCGKCTVSH